VERKSHGFFFLDGGQFRKYVWLLDCTVEIFFRLTVGNMPVSDRLEKLKIGSITRRLVAGVREAQTERIL
jgi:hypothetical protein